MTWKSSSSERVWYQMRFTLGGICASNKESVRRLKRPRSTTRETHMPIIRCNGGSRRLKCEATQKEACKEISLADCT